MSSWSGQLCGKEGYFLQFETKDYDTYRRVEKLCQDIMDEEHAKRETEKKSILNYEIDEIVGIDYTMIPDSCKNCSNHPSNGGSGICNCTLGQHSINAIPTASETMCESKAVATNKIEHELKVFNLYEEVKQSLEDAIKFESNEEELLLGYDYCVNHCKNCKNCIDIIKNEPNCIVKCIRFGILKNKIKETNNK